MTRARLIAILVMLALPVVLGPRPSAAGAADVSGVLRTQLQLSDGELATLTSGRAVVKTLRASMNREIITVGGIRIRGAGIARFVEEYKSLEGFRTSQFVLQLGKFSAEPRLSDLDGLTIEAEDIDSLRQCRVASCDVKLSADDIQRFQREIDWRSPTAARDAATLYKAILFAHLNAYRAGGRERLVHYQDRDEAILLAAETTALFEGKPSLLALAPSFQQYLQRFPQPGAAAAEDFFYWSKEEFGFKPVVGLNHVSVSTDRATGYVLIVTTQLYASHYIDGSVAINAMLPDGAGSDAGFFWLYQNRSRVGRLAGVLGAISRPIIQRRTRAGLMRSLTQTKQRFEARRSGDE